MPKIASIDLDGVLNTYNGIYEENKISSVRKGAHEFLQKISNEYLIEIYTVRDEALTKKWLSENNLMQFVQKITNTKSQYTSVYIDDRAINFDGNFEKTFSQLINFQPHWKKDKSKLLISDTE